MPVSGAQMVEAFHHVAHDIEVAHGGIIGHTAVPVKFSYQC